MKTLIQFINEQLINESLDIYVSAGRPDNKDSKEIFYANSYVVVKAFEKIASKFKKAYKSCYPVPITKDELIQFFNNLENNRRFDTDLGKDWEIEQVKNLLDEKEDILKKFDEISKPGSNGRSPVIQLYISR